ncbi:hypothetical protein ACIRBY_31785 [Streptomyces sp. NPDC096136]|uniref:hypothetical protein n=1 Tax=Streptomyces sp. NPDC096136 TaxID=3366076 RepID=UPI0037F4C58B
MTDVAGHPVPVKGEIAVFRGVFPRNEATALEEHREDLLQPLHAKVRRLSEVGHFRPKAYAVPRSDVSGCHRGRRLGPRRTDRRA